MGFTDEELISRFRGGDKTASDELLNRYKNTVRAVAHRFFLADGDKEDLVQEGMCGLYSAINSFKGGEGFSSYAYASIKNRILDAVKKAGSGRQSALNGYLPIEGGEGIQATESSPEEELIDRETKIETLAKIKSVLSPFEYAAICMYIDGATLTEISVANKKTYKQTDNAIYRAKHKLRGLFV